MASGPALVDEHGIAGPRERAEGVQRLRRQLRRRLTGATGEDEDGVGLRALGLLRRHHHDVEAQRATDARRAVLGDGDDSAHAGSSESVHRARQQRDPRRRRRRAPGRERRRPARHEARQGAAGMIERIARDVRSTRRSTRRCEGSSTRPPISEHVPAPGPRCRFARHLQLAPSSHCGGSRPHSCRGPRAGSGVLRQYSSPEHWSQPTTGRLANTQMRPSSSRDASTGRPTHEHDGGCAGRGDGDALRRRRRRRGRARDAGVVVDRAVARVGDVEGLVGGVAAGDAGRHGGGAEVPSEHDGCGWSPPSAGVPWLVIRSPAYWVTDGGVPETTSRASSACSSRKKVAAAVPEATVLPQAAHARRDRPNRSSSQNGT